MRDNERSMSEGRGLPAGTLTFLFTDIEGSTKLLNELGTERFHEVLAVHTRLLRDAFKDGVEVRIEGDALFVVFPVAAKAVRGAAAAQRALGLATFPHGATVRVRMGMHTGEGTPASAEAGADYVGIDVHRAARVAAAANGGQVLLTQATAMLAGTDLGDGLSFRELGDFRLKDLAHPEHILQLVIGGQPAEFPPIRSLDRTPTNLPPQPSTFVGREREIAEGQRLLEKARLVGDQEYPVPPLDLPNPERLPALEVLAQSDAVRLFIERATAVRPDFRVTAENAAAVAEIVFRLDGLPLAIELAAARIKVLTPQSMLPKLRQGLDMLASTARDLPERQRTLRGAIQWSWDLLEPLERRLFARLAVFVAGATLPDIERVCSPDGELGGDVLDLLSSLVEHSLIRQSEIEGEPRFRMLVLIREYAMEQLARNGESDEIARRHAEAYLALAEEARPQLQGPEQKRWLDRLELEHDNIRAALETMISRGMAEQACRALSALWRFWQIRGHLIEAENWSKRILALPTASIPPLTLMRAYEAAGGITYWQGKFEPTRISYEKTLELARAHGTDLDEANAAYNLSFVYGIPMSDTARALELLAVAKTKWISAGDEVGVARAAWARATYLQLGPLGTGDPAQLREALASVEEALAVHRKYTNRFDVAWDLPLYGMTLLKLDRFADALAAFRQSAALFRADNDLSGFAIIASDCAQLAAAKGQRERQATLVGVAESFSLRAATGQLLRSIKEQDGRWMPEDVPADLRTAYERGLAMDTESGFAYALEDVP